MRTHQLLSVAAAAATVQAFNPLHPRDLEECQAEATAVMTNLSDVPTPDATLLSYIAEQTDFASITGCEIPVITGAAGDSYTSYISSLSSWAVKHKTDIEKLWSACSDVPQVTSALNQYQGGSGACSEFTYVTPDVTGAATTEATGKASKEASSKVATSTAGNSAAAETAATSAAKTPGSSSSGSDGATETQSTGGAAQQTGMALAAAGMAAMALAGLY